MDTEDTRLFFIDDDDDKQSVWGCIGHYSNGDHIPGYTFYEDHCLVIKNREREIADICCEGNDDCIGVTYIYTPTVDL